jgi:hypothetical protein
MENKICRISKRELESIKNTIQTWKGTWVAEVDGRKALTWEGYALEIERAFRFPTPCDKSMDAYLDWITDLSWLNASGFVLIIDYIEEFMKNDVEKRQKVLWLFEKDVLPFWQSGVEQYVVEGKAKPFSVYLVS